MHPTPGGKMKYVRLGNSGLRVSKVILGTMQYGFKTWQKWILDDEEEAVKHIKFAYEAGIQTFDTANIYSNGRSEIILGKAIKQLGLPREELVIMSKVFFPLSSDPDINVAQSGKTTEELGIINQQGLSRKHIFDSVKATLARLQVDYIDLLQCHRFDYDTSIEETMHALHDVVQAGHVRYIGMSSCHAYQFHAMQNYAITNKLTPFVSIQNHYNLIYREEEREMMPTLKMFGVGSIPWSPLGRGMLTRPRSDKDKTIRGQTDRYNKGYTGAGTDDVIARVEELAKRRNLTMAQIALAWCLNKDGVTAPIVGTTSLENLKEIINAVNVNLDNEEVNFLEELYKPAPLFGHQ